MVEQRLEVLRRMAEARPEDPRLQFGLAVELLNCGQVREGAAALRAYLAVAEDEGNGWARLGGALEELGDVEGAREAYARGMEIAAGRGHEGLAEEMKEALENLA
jgi:predicted Zn-dependent protease